MTSDTTLILAAAAAGARWLEYLDAKSNPHHDARGRFASSGGGRHARRGNRAHQNPQHVHGPEHADLLKHQHAERRGHARDIRGERRQLRTEQGKERRQLHGRQARESAKLETRQGKETARLTARHEREAARHPGAATAARHAEERSDLHAEHTQERHDLAGEHRADRQSQREEHAEARRSQREDHLESIQNLRESQRADVAETLRQIREERNEGKDWDDPQAISKGPSLRDAGVPSAEKILGWALASSNLTAAYHAGKLTPVQRLALLHQVRVVSCAWLRMKAEAWLAEYGPSDEESKALFGRVASATKTFFNASRKFLKNMFVAGSLTIFGPGELSQAELDGVNANTESQYEYLDAFEQAVIGRESPSVISPQPQPPTVIPEPPTVPPEPSVIPQEPPIVPARKPIAEQPLDGTFVSRAESYGAAVWPGTLNEVRNQAVDGGIFDEERRIHSGKDAPCRVCESTQRLNWQPIGTMPAIGESPCLNRCHCHFVYRHSDNPDDVYLAGRGPLDEYAFGATG